MTEIVTPPIYIDTPSGEADIKAMAGLRVEFLRELDVALGTSPKIAYEEQPSIEETYLKRRTQNPDVLFRVVRAGEKMVGLLAGEMNMPCQGDGFIGFLYVDPLFRGQGWGSKLVRTFIDEASPKGDVDLLALGPDPQRVKIFYERLHFDSIGGGRMVSRPEKRAAA